MTQHRRTKKKITEVEGIVKPSGNSGRIYLPKQWVGKKVKTILLTSLIVMALIGVTSSQVVKGARWNSEVENQTKYTGSAFAIGCDTAFKAYPLTTFVPDKRVDYQNLLARCDNDLLIFKLDVCPSHGNSFPICSEPKLIIYLDERGLNSVTKAPIEWYTDTKLDQTHTTKPETRLLTEEERNKQKATSVDALPTKKTAADYTAEIERNNEAFLKECKAEINNNPGTDKCPNTLAKSRNGTWDTVIK
jgi:putative transposon-encoded protein